MNLDLDAFVGADMTEIATLSVGGTARVVLNNPAAGSFAGMVGDNEPVAEGKTADLSDVTIGSTLTINGTTYTVARIRTDKANGWTALDLKE